jgi:hypothetical protein
MSQEANQAPALTFAKWERCSGVLGRKAFKRVGVQYDPLLRSMTADLEKIVARAVDDLETIRSHSHLFTWEGLRERDAHPTDSHAAFSAFLLQEWGPCARDSKEAT